MKARAVLAVRPREVELCNIEICEPGEWDIVVELETAGLSIGTEAYIISAVDPAHHHCATRQCAGAAQ